MEETRRRQGGDLRHGGDKEETKRRQGGDKEETLDMEETIGEDKEENNKKIKKLNPTV